MTLGWRRRCIINISLVVVSLALARLTGLLFGDRAAGGALDVVVIMGLQTLAFAGGGQSRGDVSLPRLRRVLGVRAIGLAVVLALALGSYQLQRILILSDWRIQPNMLWLLVPLFFSALVDAMSSRPYCDEYWALGKLLISRRKSTVIVKREMGSCVIKVFFYPMMFVYIEQYLDLFDQYWLPKSWTVGTIYDALVVYCLLVDLVFGAAGYALSLKILGNRVRSVNPYAVGWFVTIICYSPFWDLVSRVLIFRWRPDWIAWTEGWPIARMIWLAMIGCSLVVYAWSTVELGTRFSNLTYRGTVATGPYRLMKHPAYVSKVASYWLITVPFVPLYGWLFAAQQCVVLLLSCSIYYLRGKYEEKHLSQYAEYRAYAASTTGRAFLDVYAGAVNRALGRV
jgi:hypothetical protein